MERDLVKKTYMYVMYDMLLWYANSMSEETFTYKKRLQRDLHYDMSAHVHVAAVCERYVNGDLYI